ncbi:MAG: FAD-dependent oxidoreductase [Myxococcota bacterium]
MPEQILILGAGLAGLSCAHHLGRACRILEKENTVGGVARTIERRGFHFDVTGHWLHLRDDGIRALVNRLIGPELITVERRAEIYSHGVRTPYPFQANTYGLPAEVVTECVVGFFAAREAEASGSEPPPQTFEDYIRLKMGDGIARHFMIPYNTKLFTVPPSEMDFSWCGRFVPIPKPEDVVLGAVVPGGANRALGYNATFEYPRCGGIARLPQSLADSLDTDIRLGVAARRLDWQQRHVELDDGSRCAYDVLVSTMPLKDLVAMLTAPPERVALAAAKLRAASVTYWDVGLRGANEPNDAHWIYFPEPRYPFYRIGSASAVVASVAPEGARSHYVEVSHPQGTACPVDDQQILDGMRAVGLIAADCEPMLMERTTIDCAYVIADRVYGEARALVLDWLREQRILSVGRYGAWTYDSMEGAMIQGRRAAETIRDLT